jgi:signal transduction histidine kinase
MGETENSMPTGAVATVLVVDDEDHARSTLQDVLADLGYRAVGAGTGHEACVLHQEVKPDLVLLDIRLPDMTGVDVLRAIREVDATVPVIMATAYASLSTAADCLNVGADSYLMKPFEMDEMVAAIRLALGRSPERRDADRYKKLFALLSAENDTLREQLAKLRASAGGTPDADSPERGRMICGAVAHSLRGEYLHIGDCVRSIRDLCRESPDVQEECDVVDRSLKYSQLALRRLLEHLDLGHPVRSLVGVGEVLATAEALVRPRLPSSVALRLSVEAGREDATIVGDSEQLLGVLIELIENARDAVRARAGTIDVSVAGKSDRVEIAIVDDGPGIPQEIRERVLKEQVPSKRGGLGMGLLFCKSVIEGMGGEIRLESDEGSGTTITLSLPLATANEEVQDADPHPHRGGQSGDLTALRPRAEAPPRTPRRQRRPGSRR